MAEIPSADGRMRYMYSQVPHHQIELMEDALWRFNELQHWHDIYPAPVVLPQMVKPALPGAPLPDFSHTSYKGSTQFVLPSAQPQQVPTSLDKGKGREFR